MDETAFIGQMFYMIVVLQTEHHEKVVAAD